MTFDDIFQPETRSLVGFVVSVLFAANTVFFRWLISSFKELRTDLKTQSEKNMTWLDTHEDKDQRRHEENLYRFEKVSVALARLGSSNGTHEQQ